ncbi:MAG TPA: aminotransferase class V-fold PLP-dependent enzyme, partial [Acidimicrobiales bacterium]|nr:aminotransferase class V-fold PLP-dependent enzyme [Acidimicrobiales bacterium]
MDVERIRADFPILERRFHGHPLIYLDSAATSQKPRSVLETESNFYATENANPHRGVYTLSVEATYAYENARVRVGRFLNVPDPAGVIFLRGTTEAINVVATSLGRGLLSPGDHVLTTVMEHHSNLVPWSMLRDRHGVILDYLDIDDDGELRLEQLDSLLTSKTKVVAVTHASNVLGTVNPIREIA